MKHTKKRKTKRNTNSPQTRPDQQSLSTTSQRLLLAKQRKARATDQLGFAVEARVVDVHDETSRQRQIAVGNVEREPLIPHGGAICKHVATRAMRLRSTAQVDVCAPLLLTTRKLLKRCDDRRQNHDALGPERARHRELAEIVLIARSMSHRLVNHCVISSAFANAFERATVRAGG